ncbi:hypothetical protein [Lentilactobacillus hilgardii]|uniref:hypothetical protein n=1 Tax=Lentilactobacillus hilgardii TaxID=1588 RepID=UPI0021A84C21|nr:hypothetical protein [Lentilactobacillus hilgardii]MCT3395897.1 hypothetical protein [Lentilactobacillus hilgardii]
MKDSKFAKQLTLNLGRFKSALDRSDIAEHAHISESQLSNIRAGRRKAPRDVKKSLVKKLWSLPLAFSASRSEFDIPSMMNNPILQQDLYADEASQKKEEHERQASEDEADYIISMNPGKRTAEQSDFLLKHFRDSFEEIGAELKYTYAKMIFAGLSEEEIKELVDEYNQKFGG